VLGSLHQDRRILGAGVKTAQLPFRFGPKMVTLTSHPEVANGFLKALTRFNSELGGAMTLIA
jgi:hypothetical protein